MTSPPHVLVVEDDPSVRGLLETLLVTEGYDAIWALSQQLGEDCVFLKPFGVAELLARVAAVTGGPTPYTPEQVR